MSQWFSSQTLHQWQRIIFSIVMALFVWWYVHDSLIISKVFTNVPVYLHNIPPGKTMVGLGKDNRLKKPITLTIVGRKKVLNRLKHDQIEVVINAAGKGDIWKEKITKEDLRQLNPDINLERAISDIEHGSLQIRLTNIASREIPIKILPPIGTLPKGYAWVDVWPDQLTHTVEGPEEAVQQLSSRRLYLTFDLNRISKQHLEKISEQLLPGSEIYYKIPESWKYIDLPAPFSEKKPLHDPEAEDLVFVIVKPAMLKIDHPIPIRVSELPRPTANSPIINTELKIQEAENFISRKGEITFWTAPIYADGVSREFLQTIKSNLECVIYVGTQGKIRGGIEIANVLRAERKYIEHMTETNFSHGNQVRENIREHISKQFWKYVTQIKYYNSSKQPLDFSFSVDQSKLTVKEALTPE